MLFQDEKNMEFRQLRYFLAVADYLHFTEAAAYLGMAQPPLSQQIIKLEKEIGTRLFIRYPRRVELTEAGLRFRERARRIVEDAEFALREAQQAGRGEVGSLSLGFAGSAVFHPVVASLLQRYRQAYPGVVIRCEEAVSPQLLGKVAQRELDAAIVRLPLNCEGLSVMRLADEEILCVLPAGHRLGRRRRIALDSLAHDLFVLSPRHLGPELHDAVMEACRKAGFSPVISQEPPQVSSAASLVAAGFGVTLVPASMRQIGGAGVTYHRLDMDLMTGIGLVTRTREKAAAIQNLLRVGRQLFNVAGDKVGG